MIGRPARTACPNRSGSRPYEALIESPADSPEAMIHRLGTLAACLLDDLAGEQNTISTEDEL